MNINIHPYIYNGAFGRADEDKQPVFTAEFVQWTDDPGIAILKCSDGRFRLVPEYALSGEFPEHVSVDENKVIKRGVACSDKHPGWETAEEIMVLLEKCERGQIDSMFDMVMAMFSSNDDEDIDEDIDEDAAEEARKMVNELFGEEE